MTRTTSLLAALVAGFALLGTVVAFPAPAEAHRTITMYEYQGQHPVPEELGDWCDQDGLHVHTYRLDPERYLVYEIAGVFHFVGDAYLRGSSRQHWYYDPHPIRHINTHWCVLEGPHSHWWQPHHHHHRQQVVWISHDGYWVWSGAYDDVFWWTWASWYDVFWHRHTRRLSHYGHYHPGHHYIQEARVRPRYDGRHRHTHHSDHRMRNARDRHSHWRSTSHSGGGEQAGSRHQGSSARSSGEREHDGPGDAGSDRPRDGQKRSASAPGDKQEEARSSYRLPEKAANTNRQTRPAKRGSYSAPSRSASEKTSKDSSSTSRTTKSRTTTQSSDKGSAVPNYRKATTTTRGKARPSSSSTRAGSTGTTRSKGSSTSKTRSQSTKRSTTTKGKNNKQSTKSRTRTKQKTTTRTATTKRRSQGSSDSSDSNDSNTKKKTQKSTKKSTKKKTQSSSSRSTKKKKEKKKR